LIYPEQSLSRRTLLRRGDATTSPQRPRRVLRPVADAPGL